MRQSARTVVALVLVGSLLHMRSLEKLKGWIHRGRIVGDFLLAQPLGAERLVIATGLAGWVRMAMQTGWLIKWRLSPGAGNG